MATNRISEQFQDNVEPLRKRSSTVHIVQSSRLASRLAKMLLFGLILTILAMALLPWQQTSRGAGEIVALSPQERPQTVKSPAKGIIQKVAAGLVEGKQVKRGDLLLEIQPFAGDMVEQLNTQLEQLELKKATVIVKAEAYGLNVTGFTEAKVFTVDAASEMVESAKEKLESKRNQVSGKEAEELQAKLNYERQLLLFRKGLKPQKEVEKLKKEWDVKQANLASVKRDVTSLQNEVRAKQNEQEEKRRVAQTKIDYARTMQQTANGEMAQVNKEISDLQIKLNTMDRLTVTAPRDGTIFRLNVNERGDTVKEGDSLLVIVPEVTQRAVELLVRGNDMPLVVEGQEVRLQFEGWPSVQVAGWPSIAIGVFSGIVKTVDRTDNGKGEFRILVTPNEGDDREWPKDRFLRQGVRANGWVALKRVRLGYEIWRQLNGFPVIPDDITDKEKIKKPKLPK